MSGDIKNRRKDKKRRKDGAGTENAAELLKRFSISTDDDDVKEQAPAPPTVLGKFESEDIQMHLQNDHGTGGHWCAKVVFFILMTVLGGLIVLIILENRGMSDVDTPLSESRYSQLFDGWVDESREQHDDHAAHGLEEHEDEEEHEHEILESLNDLDSHEHDQESFPEEPEAQEDESEEDLEPEDAVSIEEENVSAEVNYNEQDVTENVVQSEEIREEVTQHETELPESAEAKDSFENGDEPFEEFEDDGSFEQVVDNDSGEDLHLQKIAEKAQEKVKRAEEPVVQESSIAVKIIVGLALLVVAYLVLVKKYKTNESLTEPSTESIVEKKHTMADQCEVQDEERMVKRRQTLISTEDAASMDKIDTFDDEINSGDEEEYTDEEFIEDAELIDEGEIMIDDQSDNEGEIDSGDEEIVDDELYDNYEDNEEEVIIAQHITLPQKLEELNSMFTPKTEIVENESLVIKPEAPPTETPLETEIIREVVETTETTNNVEEQDHQAIDPEEEYEEDLEYIEDEEYYGEEEDMENVENESGEEIEDEIDDDDVEYEEESDIDDSDLMKRLDQKYGRIEKEASVIEKEMPTADDQRGAQSFEDDSNDSYLNLELRRAESLLQDKPVSALKQFERILLKHPKSYVALYGKAKALDKLSTVEKSNQLLMEAIDDYKKVLGYGQQLNDTFFIEVAEQCLQRMKFLGQHAKAVGIHEKLIARFNENPDYRNQLAVTYLLMNRLADAKRILHETLLKWRANGYALVHYGFVLKNFDQNLEKAVEFMREGIATNEPGTQDGRFYFHLGDALARLGRKAEAMEVYEVGAKKKLFLSKYQRSLYNVDRLRSQPFWTAEQTMYKQNLDDLRLHWKQIRDEALKILNEDGVFKNEAESLKAAGDWKQFELFARGNRIHKNCARTPFTCALIEKFPAAKNCKRGQVKFSVMIPGTRVWPHCGPTNCRIRAHLGLVVPNGPYITVAEQTRTWKEGEWLIFDDSFEHEVFHNGTSTRLVLIVDVWHPDLTTREQNTLEPI